MYSEEKYLQKLVEEKIPITLFLLDGIQRRGHIDGYDEYTIQFTDSVVNNSAAEMVYKHAISTIKPFRQVKL